MYGGQAGEGAHITIISPAHHKWRRLSMRIQLITGARQMYPSQACRRSGGGRETQVAPGVIYVSGGLSKTALIHCTNRNDNACLHGTRNFLIVLQHSRQTKQHIPSHSMQHSTTRTLISLCNIHTGVIYSSNTAHTRSNTHTARKQSADMRRFRDFA